MQTDPVITGYVEHITREGETFDALALQMYNDEQKASLIIRENLDYCDVLIFEAGVRLFLPVFETVETPDTLPPWRRGE